ncbi:molybdopterin-dependent oxidoreductase [Candidatus Nitrospira bockiana]
MNLSRRTILKALGLGAAAGMLGGCDSVGSVFGRMFAMPPRETVYFTPNDKFYVVNYMDSPFNLSRDIDQEQWRLHITGEVKSKTTLGWRDILNRDSFEQVVTLECIDTLPGGDSLGNALWRGISLKKLLQDVGADEETARDVVFRAADGYDDSIPFTRATQDDVMLAYLMNGEKLPKAHGFPLRLIVPGLYGIKNVKWITEIEVYNGDYLGYWQRKGWTDDGTIKIFSRIDSPGHYQALRGAEHDFRGIAFGGPNTIAKVELSFDAGKTWHDAAIDPPQSPYSWVIWNYRWRPPKPGKFQVAVRATDVKGNLQIEEIVRPQPAGASGYHTIIADVEALEPTRA